MRGARGDGCAVVRISPAGCYHFATQLDGTAQNGLVQERGCEGTLDLKLLTKWHVKERPGMAETELGNRCSIRLSYGTNGKICALGFLKMLAFVQCMP